MGSCEVHTPHQEGKFLYFAFGSNLYDARIRRSCPSAARVGAGRLAGFRLTFNYNSLRWRGHVATIKESAEDHLWGCIWSISTEELAALDFQEGVHIGFYRPLQVEVTSPEGITIPVRTYQMALPYEENTRPSTVYKRVMSLGARQSGLPDEYLHYIDNIEDNGYDGPVEIECDLKYRQDANTPHYHTVNPDLSPVAEPEHIVPGVRRSSNAAVTA